MSEFIYYSGEQLNFSDYFSVNVLLQLFLRQEKLRLNNLPYSEILKPIFGQGRLSKKWGNKNFSFFLPTLPPVLKSFSCAKAAVNNKASAGRHFSQQFSGR